MTLKKKILAIAAGIMLLFSLTFIGKLWEDVDAGEIVIIQDPFDGDLHVVKEPGFTWQGLGKATHYKKSNQFWFTFDKDGKPGNSISVKWNDGGHADMGGSVRYDLPLDNKQLIALHSTFGSQEAIENHLIKTNIEKAVYMAGPLMSSKESYAEKRNDLIYYIEDQASKGVYKTRQVESVIIDQLTNTEKTTVKVEIIIDSSTKQPQRQEISPVVVNGIKLYNISINTIKYDTAVEKQIATQQQATMQVQTAIANAKRAEQDAITTAKQGEAEAAKAKWDQEVIKAKQVTEAEAAKAVATLAVQTAELNKKKNILEGEGEAAKKRLVMQANGALEQKLEVWLKAQGYWATAFQNYQGNMVPLYQSGGNNNSSNAMNFMELMMMKNARDLNLDLNNKK